MIESNPLFDDYKAAIELLDSLVKIALDDDSNVFDIQASIIEALTEDALPLIERFRERNR